MGFKVPHIRDTETLEPIEPNSVANQGEQEEARTHRDDVPAYRGRFKAAVEPDKSMRPSGSLEGHAMRGHARRVTAKAEESLNDFRQQMRDGTDTNPERKGQLSISADTASWV